MLTDGPLLSLINLPRFSFSRNSDRILTENQRVVGSGKSAIVLALAFFKSQGYLNNRFEEILCPPWMGGWVYSCMTEFAFPAQYFSENAKILYIYHQFGFMQDVDYLRDFALTKGLVVIEDSAHQLRFSDRKLDFATIGEIALHSPPKFISSSPLGVVQSLNQDFLSFVDTAKKDGSKIDPAMNAIARWKLDQRLRSDHRFSIPYAMKTQKIASRLYSSYPFTPNSTIFAENSIVSLLPEYEQRFRRLREAYGAIPNELLPMLSPHNMESVPFKIPVKLSDSQIAKILTGEFQSHVGFNSVHFDFKQNMLRPAYQKAICIRIHSGITDTQFDLQISEVLRALKVK